MKPNVFFLATALVILSGAAGSGCAHQQNAAQTAKTYPNSANATYLTGSNLPQNVKRNGPVTDGRNNLRVIDNSDINRSGGADVNQTLRQLGVTP